MAQVNVAREPSMDEILASIRKIIESNEPGLPAFPANDAGFAQTTDHDDDEDMLPEHIGLTIDDAVAGFRDEMEDISHSAIAAREPLQAKTDTPEIPSPPMSLADVAARVRAASERHSAPAQRAAEMGPLPSRSYSAQPEPRMTASPIARPVAAPTVEAPQRSEPMLGAAYPHAADASSYPSVASTPHEPVRDAAQGNASALVNLSSGNDHDDEMKPGQAVSDKDIAAIVSPAVGQQVARSFEDLALAVDSSARRSFDEIAQDMLRPMLQEWLDDNLPTLVEKLVREEIERVARGPRR